MADLDSNPFADPEANPFADPSVTQARQAPPPDGLEDFNPFDGANQTKSVPPPQPAAPPQPAVMQPTQDPPPYSPPTYDPNAVAAMAATEDLKRRQEELERKAAELQRKEQELQRNMDYQTRKNNFPVLPEKCCVQPCFYQDFELDIPLEFQKIVKILYYVWIAYSCVLLVNCIAALAYFIASNQYHLANKSGATFGVSILYLVLIPCSFVCWYRPVYKAFRSDSSFNFFVFFFIFFFQFIVCILQALGIDGWGTVGWLTALQMTSVNGGVAAFMFIVAALFSAMAVVALVLLIKVHRIYRSTGASFAKAQEEFAQGVMTNKTVQSTAVNVGTTAARGAMANQGGENRR